MKKRATVTTCDAPECDTHFMGDEYPAGWLKVVVQEVGQDKKERLTFESFTCLNNYAFAQAEAKGEETSTDGD